MKETSFFIRPRVEIETKYRETFKVNFHLEGASEPNCFSWRDLKVGNTMEILYAESKVFLDGECGIRQESPVTCMVFPVTILELTNEYDLLLTRLNPTNKLCFTCGKPEAEGEMLLKCSRCKSALYCNKVCQSKHWKTVHKKLCLSVNKLVKLASVNFDRFERHLTWDFQETLRMPGSVAPVPRDEDSSDEERDKSEDVRCSACLKGKASSSFSKKQLRKNPSKRRCKSCIQADRPWGSLHLYNSVWPFVLDIRTWYLRSRPAF
jgi:hypothetical protein